MACFISAIKVSHIDKAVSYMNRPLNTVSPIPKADYFKRKALYYSYFMNIFGKYN